MYHILLYPLIISYYYFCAGLFFILPCIDSYQKVDLRTVSFDVPPQEVLTVLSRLYDLLFEERVSSVSAVSFDNNQVSTLAFRFWPKTVWPLQWMQLFTSASVTQPCQSLMWKRLISQLVCLHRQHCEISLAPKISVKFWQTVKRSAMLCRYRHNFGIINLCLLEIIGLGFICLLHFVDFSW